jgi:hypothetical protein
MGGDVIASICATIGMTKIRHFGLRWLPIGHGPHNNQPKTGIRDARYDGKDMRLGGTLWGVLSHCFGESSKFNNVEN